MTPANQPNNHSPRLVIVGGGFGGLAAARALAGRDIRITLVDKSNHHLFQPLLYQVATAGLSPADIARPIRSLLSGQENVTVLLDEVVAVKTDENLLLTRSGKRLDYDHLILAAGARHSYFGRDEWERTAPGLKTIEDALGIRERVLHAFERGERSANMVERDAALTFVVVGGGPTGIEMAGAIAELARFSLRRDFKNINPASARIILVEAGPRLLPQFSEASSEAAKRHLESLGVEVRTGRAVTSLGAEGVTMDGEAIRSGTVVWAAGNQASPLGAMLGCPTDRAGRVLVNPDLTVPEHPEIQVIGDMAATTFGRGKPVPGVSPAAMQAGRHAARNVLRRIAGQPPARWKYFDKGSMATVGRHLAVAEAAGLRFSGFIAWFLWAFVHLYFLVGFRNRLFVFMQWAWAYLTFSKGARLITSLEDTPPRRDPAVTARR